MVGLVFAESLRLTWPQWVALGMNTGGWLWGYSTLECSSRQAQRQVAMTATLTLASLWLTFWNTSTSIDQQVLFEQAWYLSRFSWQEFLEAFALRPYVEYQPPFLTFFFSRYPVFWFHQGLLFPFALLCVGLMWRLYGRQASLLCATPVFALMIHQPCTDTVLFGCLLIVLRLCQVSTISCRRRLNNVTPCQSLKKSRPRPEMVAAALLYGVSWMIKPLTLATAPCIMPQLGAAGLGTVTIWGGYLWWSQQREFGRRQAHFLLHQLFMTRLTSSRRARPRPPGGTSRLRRLWRMFSWRWRHVGQHAVRAVPFYLGPAWLRPWIWQGYLVTAMILVGCGNSKYLLLDLLFLFPIDEASERRVTDPSLACYG